MKTYVKPAMMALSISANDALCACTIKPEDQMFKDIINDWGIVDLNSDNKITGRDFADGLYFTTAEASCGNDYKINIEGYCKFTGSSNVLFGS